MTNRNRTDFDFPKNGRYLRPWLFLFPVLLGLVWGAYFDDDVYDTYRFAQNLAAGRGLAYDAGIAPQSAPRSPLTIGILALFPTMMIPAGLLFSALGWGAAAVAVCAVCRVGKRPFTAIITPVLILFNPLLLTTPGSPIPWSAALGWAAIAMSLRPSEMNSRWAWIGQTGILLLMLAVFFDASTVGLAALLLGYQWLRSKRIPWQSMLALLAVVVGWGGFVVGQWDQPLTIRPFSHDGNLIQLIRGAELYGLFLPFMLLGGWQIWVNRKSEKGTILVLVWTALTWLLGSPTAGVITAVTALFLVGLGIEWLVEWAIKTQTIPIAPIWLAIILASPLLLIQLVSVGQQYAARPAAQSALEAQLANWLRAYSEPDTTLYAASRIGYLADRATLPVKTDNDQLSRLMSAEPDIIITAQNLAWNQITGTGWFRDRYLPIRQFADDYAPNSPLIVWEHTRTPFDSGQPQPISAVTPGRIEMVGYKYEPMEIKPGDDIYLTVYLQATQPITVGFQTEVNLTYALDEWVWAWKRELTPRSVPAQLWPPGQIISERIKLETEETIPFGAYKLQVLWKQASDESLWPIYRDNDENVLDRIILGYVAVPPPVDDAQATPVNARFGDQVNLSGYEVLGGLTPGETAEVILYWQALRPPDDNYFVFVHLLNEAGQSVANHDSQPMNGRFATRAWQPGMMVADSHSLNLPPDLPPGLYHVAVGMYLRETGVRLPVWDAVEGEQANGSLPLTLLEIGSGQ